MNSEITSLLKQRLGTNQVSEPKVTLLEGNFEIQYGDYFGYLSEDGRYLFMANLIDLQLGKNLTDITRRKMVVDELGKVSLKNKIVYAAIGAEEAESNVFTDTTRCYCQKLLVRELRQ